MKNKRILEAIGGGLIGVVLGGALFASTIYIPPPYGPADTQNAINAAKTAAKTDAARYTNAVSANIQKDLLKKADYYSRGVTVTGIVFSNDIHQKDTGPGQPPPRAFDWLFYQGDPAGLGWSQDQLALIPLSALDYPDISPSFVLGIPGFIEGIRWNPRTNPEPILYGWYRSSYNRAVTVTDEILNGSLDANMHTLNTYQAIVGSGGFTVKNDAVINMVDSIPNVRVMLSRGDIGGLVFIDANNQYRTQLDENGLKSAAAVTATVKMEIKRKMDPAIPGSGCLILADNSGRRRCVFITSMGAITSTVIN